MIHGKSYSKKEIKVDANGRVRVRTINPLPTKTQQQYKDQCDLHKIVERARRTGELPRQRAARGYYMDCTVLPTDYQKALDLVIEGNNAFNNLSSDVRKRFENDPKKLLEFLSDSKNKEEAIKLGLIEAQVETAPVENANKAQPKKAKKDVEPNNDSE